MIDIAGTSTADGTTALVPVMSAQDLSKADAIKTWLTQRGQTRAWLSRKARISSTVVSQVLNGRYPASPSSYLDQMLAVIQLETERMGDGLPGHVEGSVHKLVMVVCDRTRKHANFGVVCGRVGVGKTHALKEYRRRKPQTLLVEANPQMTAGSLLGELLKQLGAALAPGLDRKFEAVVRALEGTNYLVIVDEAEKLTPTAMEYLRRIRDKASVGVVLSGTEKLHSMLKPEQGQFDQVRSRVGMWPPTIQAISRDDADDMARAVLGVDTAMDVSDEVLDALWSYCAGSARMLMENFLPALRDFAGANPLSAKLVDAVAQKALFVAKREAKA